MSGIKSIVLVAVIALFSFPLQAAERAMEADRTIRIIGGSEVPDLRYPWMAAIYFRTQNNLFAPACGGSLIADRWILTAAHCMVQDGEVRDPNNVAFLLGELDLTSDGGLFDSVSRIIVHPEYDAATITNDIALLELPDPVDFLTPITLPNLINPVPENGERATVTGWGLTSENGAPSSILQEVDLPIVSHNNCFSFYALDPLIGVNSETSLCAGAIRAGGRDSCQGDSGGPLFVQRGNQFVQAGVVSFGVGCARPSVPGVYSRVAPFFDWINSFVNSPTVYDGNSDDGVVGVNEVIESLEANSQITASIPAGETRTYRVTASNRITLETIQGDADLFVYNSPVFSLDSQVCTSFLASPVDECVLNNTDTYYVAVLGFFSSDYNITASNGLDDVIVPAPLATLQLDIPENSALLNGITDIYRSTTGSNAILTSISGDADLMVFSTDEFNIDNLICLSQESGSALDSCTYGESDPEVFIAVFGSTDANYQLSVSSSPPVVTEEPPVAEEPPPVMVSEPPAVAEEPPVVAEESPVEVDEPPAVTDETPEDMNEPLAMADDTPSVTPQAIRDASKQAAASNIGLHYVYNFCL